MNSCVYLQMRVEINLCITGWSHVCYFNSVMETAIAIFPLYYFFIIKKERERQKIIIFWLDRPIGCFRFLQHIYRYRN